MPPEECSVLQDSQGKETTCQITISMVEHCEGLTSTRAQESVCFRDLVSTKWYNDWTYMMTDNCDD